LDPEVGEAGYSCEGAFLEIKSEVRAFAVGKDPGPDLGNVLWTNQKQPVVEVDEDAYAVSPPASRQQSHHFSKDSWCRLQPEGQHIETQELVIPLKSQKLSIEWVDGHMVVPLGKV
jgi:hypothetical protein